MYTDWFKLSRLPFRLRPDADFLYLSDETARIYEAVRAAIDGSCKVVCVLGEPGVGKSTILQALAKALEGTASVARVQQPCLTPEELKSTLNEQFGSGNAERAEQPAVPLLKRGGPGAARTRRARVILVDEAHQCSAALLREVLHFAALKPTSSIVLAGEAALRNCLASLEPQDAALPPAPTMELPRLRLAQIAGYLEHRLSIAGNDGRRLFDADTAAEIRRYSGGTPKLINILCDRAMMLAETHSQARVGVVEIREAVQELNWVEFSAHAAAPAGVPGTRQAAAPPRAK